MPGIETGFPVLVPALLGFYGTETVGGSGGCFSLGLTRTLPFFSLWP